MRICGNEAARQVVFVARTVVALALLGIFSGIANVAMGQDFKKKVIYQIVTDRFLDGDLSNDDCRQSRGLFDPAHTNWRLYWGGDLAGIRKKLAYLRGMGVGAMWISPPVDNINVSIPDSSGKPTAPYHGYAARDFMRIEEHFGDCNNSWAAFDDLVAAAHRTGIKVIVDFAANHTSDRSAGEFGALYDNGKFMTSYDRDPNGFFHHTPEIERWDDPYQLQYDTLFNLADLNQTNPTIDAYLKSALRKFQEHGADGFRLDAIRHVIWGWAYTLADAAHTYGPSFLFGEWAAEPLGSALYRDSYKFANQSGMSLLDYPLTVAIRNVFSGQSGFREIDDTLRAEDHDFRSPNDLVTFVDNHDLPRLLSIKDRRRELEESLAFVLTCRGIPVVYYGDEQYLHNDTHGGNDPYNRVMMTSWDTSTRAYRLITELARLRASNDALAYGSFRERWLTSDVYVFERRYADDVVLVAINRNENHGFLIRNVSTALPLGNYRDYLNGLLSGPDITVQRSSGPTNLVRKLALPCGGVGVWEVTEAVTHPEVGSIEPTAGQAGMQVTIDGEGFGNAAGSLWFGELAAKVQSWSNTRITFAVPKVESGNHEVRLRNASHAEADPIPFTVLAAQSIPVTFVVDHVPALKAGEAVFLTGNTVELGEWGTTFDKAVGPLLHHQNAEWFITAAMPAGLQIKYKYFKTGAEGSVLWERDDKRADHMYEVPRQGVGFVRADWEH